MKTRVRYEKPTGLPIGKVAPVKGQTPCGATGFDPQVVPACTMPGYIATSSCSFGETVTEGWCASGNVATYGKCQSGSSPGFS